ncbi:GNAT family N-acetyltransferase [Pseudomonas lundensis]|uniref:GNAT family N-acetyltransferase n=1 Tax=Serratia proteamaculans TaxID=28151 RepID=UPI002981384C|nr:GNAT family N-acetyltransferase [Serratia proteamaculans]MDW5500433.1 GNAT family N-acetyltransferase [Serratia proteamaculans]MDW5505499.1 GNAT family N-acetyltransferase [Pseudomonas lundensis]
MIELRDMNRQEFERYCAHGIEEYARDLARSLSLNEEQARVEAAASFNDSLPQGLATPNHRLVCARLAGSEENIAIVWYSIKQRTYGKQLFVYDFEVDSAWRGKGYGEKILSAVLDAGRADGAEYAELAVFDDNPTAARLYARLGFKAVNTRMHRKL